ncbi:DUF3857 domain-containing protein, partial [Salmonella enterica subsp. enterica]|nr:DUF3857 domain-containing protein [Salmonella enterica subsp. enterica serovar Enteritidis]
MRKSILYALAAYALLVFTSGGTAFADATIDRTPPPAWVELIDPPEADPAAVKAAENGIAAHLSEYQVKQTPEGFDIFDRYVYTIVDRAGLDEGAAVEWTFDPTRHHVSVNHLRVIRDGKVLDQSDAKPDVYRRETDAERGIFDGRLTARFNLEDVRVGDTIDYARTVTVKQLTERGLMSRSFSTEWTQPIGLVRQRVIWSEPLTIRKVGTDVEPEITRSGADTIYEWRVANPKPKRAEEYVPAGYPSTGWVELSNADDWGPIVDRLVDVYRTDSPLPPSYEQQVSDLTALVLTPQERMIAAIRLVQDEIRYVSLSIGAGSYEPRKPVEVVRSGFGDC